MWNRPWKLKDGYLIGCGLVITGLLLQSLTGPVCWELFAWPVNIIAVGLFFIMMAIASLIYNKVYVVRYLASYHAAVPAISMAALLTVCMGLIRQGKNSAAGDFMGFTDALTSWPFVLIYVWMTVILGLTTVSQIMHLSVRQAQKPYKWTALVCHVGLLIVLLCGTLGHADKQDVCLYTEQGFVNITYDPWQPVVLIGILLLMAGSVGLILIPRQKPGKENHDG